MKFYFQPYSWCRSSLLFKIQAHKQCHHFSALACRPLHQKRLGQEFMHLQSTHIRIQTFWDNLNYNQVVLFQIFDKLPAPLEINSQMTATCLAHTLFFKVTTHHHIFWWCAVVQKRGLSQAVELHAACMPVGPLLPQGVIITFCYDIDLLVPICRLYYIHKFLFLFIIFTLYWTKLNYFIQSTKVIS